MRRQQCNHKLLGFPLKIFANSVIHIMYSYQNTKTNTARHYVLLPACQCLHVRNYPCQYQKDDVWMKNINFLKVLYLEKSQENLLLIFLMCKHILTKI